ncbi:MAG: energy transducer TonB [Advenella sp.]
MHKSSNIIPTVPFSIRLAGAVTAAGILATLGFITTLEASATNAKVEEAPVFVSIFEETVSEAPQGEVMPDVMPPQEDQVEEALPEPEPEPEPVVEPKPEPVVEPEPEPVVEPEPEPVVELEPEPVMPIKPPEPKPEPKPEPPKVVKKEVKPKKKVELEKTKAKPVPKSQKVSEQAPPVTKPIGVPQGNPNVKPGSSSADSAPIVVRQVGYRVRPKVNYPMSSQRRGEKGTVIVRVLIDRDGAVKRVSVLKGTPYDALNKAALNAVRQARFKPHTENGVPREALADIPIKFE